MTNDSMTLIQAVQQGGDEDLLRQLAEVALANLMAFEVEGLVGAAKGKHAHPRPRPLELFPFPHPAHGPDR